MSKAEVMEMQQREKIIIRRSNSLNVVFRVCAACVCVGGWERETRGESLKAEETVR